MLLHYARRKPAVEPSAPEPSAPIAAGSLATTGQQQFHCQSIVKFLPRSGSADPAGDDSCESVCLPPPGSIRGLILDADLMISNTAAWCRSLALLLTQVGHEPAGSLQHRLWRNLHLADVFRGRRELGDVLEEYLESLSIARGRRDEVLAASLSQWREGQSPLHFLPGVRQTLRRITASGAKLAIVADSTVCGHEFENQLHDAGLGDICSAVVTSVDVDSVLPDAELYRFALDRLGIGPHETLCVAQECALAPNESNAALTCAFSATTARELGSSIGRLEDLVGLFQPLAALAKAG